MSSGQLRKAILLSIVYCLWRLRGISFASHVANADGPSDNNLATVRRIPKLGITVPREREAALRGKLVTLQQRLLELSEAAIEVQQWLPDVMIFERAVRCALDYQEFFAETEFDRADQLLDEGLSRAALLQSGKGATGWPHKD